MKRTWASDAAFDFQGRFYRVRGAHSDVRPVQTPHPLIIFGGALEGALEMATAECDVFAIYAEPRATTAERIAGFRARLGVSSFLMRGFDPVSDTIEFGRELIPRLRAGCLKSTGGRLPRPADQTIRLAPE